MKQETKELLEWIEKQINLAGTIVTDVSQPYWQEDRDKALKFLNSLPEIESKLCRGGYIQDKNGTPCCNGDRVKFQISETPSMERHIEKHGAICDGILKWNPTIRAFIIMFDKPTWKGDWIDFGAGNDDIEWFEKIEG